MNDQKNPDYLSRLPPELLDDIFDLAVGSAAIVKAPLSHALQPHIERAFYRQVSLYYASSFVRFGETVSAEKLLLVRSLKVEQSFDVDNDYEPWEPERAIEWEFNEPDQNELVTPLRRVANLENLSIVGSTRLCLLVLLSPIAASSLPSLKSLNLESTFVGIEDPFHPSHYANLQCYRNLERLSLTLRRFADTIEPSSVPMPSPFISLSSLRCLHISGPISASRHVSSLLECLPNLREISLDDETSSVRIFCLLNSLPSPCQLTSISVTSFSTASNIELPVLPISFASFTSLQTLNIAGSVDLEDSTFDKDLYHLPLRHLKLGDGTKLSASGLKNLLEGSSNRPRLGCVTLDNLDSRLAYDDVNIVFPWYEPESDHGVRASIALRRVGPHWTDQFSKEGFLELVRIAEQKGINIRGRTLDALRLEKKFESGEVERERVIAREKRAREKARK